MSYPAPFHRLVLIGSIYEETFNTSLSIIPVGGTIGLPHPDEVESALTTAIVQFWGGFSGTSAQITQRAVVTSYKLNLIGTDGRYFNDGPGNEVILSGTVGGGAFAPPAQLATVATLRTTADRGLASKGRMFLPACAGYQDVDTNGQAATSAATRVAGAVRQFFIDINAAYAAAQSGDEALGRVGVASDKGVGQFRQVTKVAVGRVPDTMRSRRGKLDEDPFETAALP